MSDLNLVFQALVPFMRACARDLDVKKDNESEFYVDMPLTQKNGKPLFFGAVQIKANYVTYHLMPVYVNPSLLSHISPELKRRMQGKACFNFKKIDPALFEELAELTQMGLKQFQAMAESEFVRQ